MACAAGASGRSWIPLTVVYFDHESPSASRSSFANFGDMFTLVTIDGDLALLDVVVDPREGDGELRNRRDVGGNA